MRKHTSYCILLAGLASAQAMSATEHSDTTAHVLKAIEVTAKASVEATSAAPLRRIDHAQMLKSGVTDVSDAIHRMPGVTLKDYGGAGGLKTVSVRGFGAGHTGVIFDDVPLSDVQSGQIDLSRYSIDNVDAVSMVIGDNDDIFIPARLAASAATVSISSFKLIDRFQLDAKLRGGSWGYINPFLRIGTPLGEHAAINFVGEFTHADNNYPFKLQNGSITTTERRNNSRMNSGHVEINFCSRPDSRTSVTAKAYYYNNERRLPGPVIYYNNINHERLHDQNAFAQMQIKRSMSAKLSAMAIAKFNYASSFYHDANGKYPGGVLNQNYWQREYYAATAWMYMPAEHWAIDYSADYFYNSLNSNLPTDTRPYRNSLLQSLTARYRSRHISVLGRLLYSLYFNGAKRGEAARNASKLSPSVCVSYQPVRSQLFYLRASYKNIFRMPTFTECYFDHYGSADILPETTDQLNLGLTYTTPSSSAIINATFTVDGYFNTVKDMIVAVPYNMFVWSMVNLGNVHIIGLDATAAVTAKIATGHEITINANYSFQRAMPRTNPESLDWMKQVAYIPRNSGSASISYDNPLVNASFYGTAVGERFTTNENLPATRIAGYTDFGAALWREFAVCGHLMGLRIEVLNIFNQQYCVVARYPMPGRNFRATISFSL